MVFLFTPSINFSLIEHNAKWVHDSFFIRNRSRLIHFDTFWGHFDILSIFVKKIYVFLLFFFGSFVNWVSCGWKEMCPFHLFRSSPPKGVTIFSLVEQKKEIVLLSNKWNHSNKKRNYYFTYLDPFCRRRFEYLYYTDIKQTK